MIVAGNRNMRAVPARLAQSIGAVMVPRIPEIDELQETNRRAALIADAGLGSETSKKPFLKSLVGIGAQDPIGSQSRRLRD